MSTRVKTVNARYTATRNGSSIEMTVTALPLEIHQMIAWIIHHEESAAELLPEYLRIRKQDESE